MSTLDKAGGFLLTLAITLIMGALLTILQVHIIYEVAEMYHLFPVVAIPVEMMYGSIMVIGLVRAKLPKDDESTGLSTKEVFSKAIGKQLTMVTVYLIAWGLAGLFHIVVF